MQAAVNARSNLEADLRQGLARSELLVHYQPVVDHQGKLVGAEAPGPLAPPARGMISPAEFIPLAEQTGLILPWGKPCCAVPAPSSICGLSTKPRPTSPCR